MKSIDQIESLLRQTPVPCVVEGPHREQLKQRLLEQSQTAQPRREPMSISAFRRMPSLVKLAAALLVAAMLIGTGWAAEKIYKIVAHEASVFMHIKPSGVSSELVGYGITAEDEKRMNEEIKQLVAKRKYEFVRTIHHPQGDESNVYYFHLSDGNRLKWKQPPPRLEDVASMDEYEQKSAAYSAQRKKEIEEAIASGKGRLINIITKETQICRDVESNKTLEVLRIAPQCPEEGTDDFAQVYPGGRQEYKKAGDYLCKSSRWPEHLQAIRDGRRELLDIRIEKQGIYEVVREDGSKFVFSRELPPQEKGDTK